MTNTPRTVGDILDETAAENERAVIGGNKPPAEPTPFEAIQTEINDLYGEAKVWLDGDPIENETQAAGLAVLREKIRKAAKRAEELRVAEAKVFDDGKKEVQERYNPLIQKGKGKTELALDTIAKTMAPYLKKIDDEQRAEALRLRKVAEDAARDALEASKAAAQTGNLEQRESAEELLDAAKNIAKTMKVAEKAKPQIHGATRAIGMKSVWTATLVDPAKAIEYYRATQPAALKEWMMEQAAKDIRVGSKPPQPIPGFTIKEDRVPA